MVTRGALTHQLMDGDMAMERETVDTKVSKVSVHCIAVHG